jgi:hypothetical protein
LIGGKGTFTPLQQVHDLPPGTYDVEFEADVFPPVKLGNWPADFTAGKPVKITVAQRLNLGN